MKYEKAALSFEQQADRLIGRGLQADRNELIRRLEAVSYYRLSGYLFPFRSTDCDHFREGTTLAVVWDRYCFDRRLRVLTLDAIERIEVSIRIKIIYHFTHAHGPFGYLDESNVPKLRVSEYLEWRLALEEETRRSKEAFKEHFFSKYSGHRHLPLWMAAELMTLGSLLTFFKGVSPEIKRLVAAEYGFPDELVWSWLRSLNAARNLCAHHARFWNRVLGYPPMLPHRTKIAHKPRRFNRNPCTPTFQPSANSRPSRYGKAPEIRLGDLHHPRTTHQPPSKIPAHAKGKEGNYEL